MGVVKLLHFDDLIHHPLHIIQSEVFLCVLVFTLCFITKKDITYTVIILMLIDRPLSVFTATSYTGMLFQLLSNPLYTIPNAPMCIIKDYKTVI